MLGHHRRVPSGEVGNGAGRQPLEPSIEDVAEAIPGWAGRAIETTPIAGGLTNRNYRVTVDGAPYFVRIPGPGTDLLAVDRANELHNTRAAAQAGAGPRVVAAVARWDAMVLEWLEARTMSNATLREPGRPTQIAASLRRLHAGPRFRDDFDMGRLIQRYLEVVEERAIAVPGGYRGGLGAVGRIERVLARHRMPTVPCHNDLLAENYLDDGSRLWIVDYEYSGNNDPTFELGNTAQELGYDAGQQEELCAAYFGEETPALRARMRLQMIMSDMGWALWAAIQARISTIDYDFWGWAVERWQRAEDMLGDPGFEGWLEAV
jgi:thiamine kinase-like enzyme